MSENDSNQLQIVQRYRKLVFIYEALDEKIDDLIMANGGGTENMSEDDLKQYLRSKYAKEQITTAEIDSIIRKLELYPSSALYESNKEIMKLIADGFPLKREDRSKKDLFIQLIDYRLLEKENSTQEDKLALLAAEGMENYKDDQDQNIYKVINQLEIQGYEKRVPDAIVYINGLPLVVIEFKSAVRENATIHDAFIQLTIRYKRDIPELFKYNAFCVISDGVNNKAGSLYAPYEYFYVWRRTEGMSNEVDGIDSLYSLISGMFHKSRLLNIIRNFVFFPDTSAKDEKIVCRYPQFYAATKLYKNISFA